MKMQMHVDTLENVSGTELASVLNAAFANYFVEIKIDESQLNDKIALERIDRSMSAGIFTEGRLVGFALIGIEGETSYNGGTGVLPEFRGNAMTERMYELIIPKLRTASIRSHTLEAIIENTAAIRAYESIGFSRVRTLACFSGKAEIARGNDSAELRQLDDIEDDIAVAFCNALPSWQNSLAAVRKLPNSHDLIGAFLGGELAGYLIYSGRRVKQFAVAPQHRRRGIGTALFSQFAGDEITITNIDRSDSATISFLEKLGLKVFLEQYEMMFGCGEAPSREYS